MFDGSNTRVVGCYHHMSVQQEAAFQSVLHSKLQMWGVQAVTNQMSCGRMVEVSGGLGAGTSDMLMTSILTGCFVGYYNFLTMFFIIVCSLIIISFYYFVEVILENWCGF